MVVPPNILNPLPTPKTQHPTPLQGHYNCSRIFMLLNTGKRKDVKAKGFVEHKLLMRLKIFVVLVFIFICLVAGYITIGYIDLPSAIGAAMLGMMIGAVAVRRKKIMWHEETSTVIARMDRIGIIVLIAYILLSVLRHWLFAHWLHGHILGAFSLAFTTGAMFGRLLLLRTEIREILREKEII
jgi:NhaP-type Na+/H+ and K+/H+ antiporter